MVLSTLLACTSQRRQSNDARLDGGDSAAVEVATVQPAVGHAWPRQSRPLQPRLFPRQMANAHLWRRLQLQFLRMVLRCAGLVPVCRLDIGAGKTA